jgi:hypothetical protein
VQKIVLKIGLHVCARAIIKIERAQISIILLDSYVCRRLLVLKGIVLRDWGSLQMVLLDKYRALDRTAWG